MFYPCHCSLQVLGVDSAEADKVGSQGFRFCAYVGSALYEGVRYRRAALARCSDAGFAVCRIAGSSNWALCSY